MPERTVRLAENFLQVLFPGFENARRASPRRAIHRPEEIERLASDHTPARVTELAGAVELLCACDEHYAAGEIGAADATSSATVAPSLQPTRCAGPPTLACRNVIVS